jgi:hypothetical protein
MHFTWSAICDTKVNVAMRIVENLASTSLNKISKELRSLIFIIEDGLAQEWEILL